MGLISQDIWETEKQIIFYQVPIEILHEFYVTGTVDLIIIQLSIISLDELLVRWNIATT